MSEKATINSAVQLHCERVNIKPERGGDKRLYIDMDICSAGKCRNCVTECSYWHHQQFPRNRGIISVMELVVYYLVCRRCEEPHCVNSCPAEALEQNREKILIRHNMRCISCKSCSHACPYGTIYPENVPYLIHSCDFCFDRRDDKNEPLCIKSCPYGALSLRNADEKPDKNTFLIGDNLMAHSTHWGREKV